MEKTKLKQYIECLEVWSETKGFTIIFSKDEDDSIDLESKLICINNRKSLEHQFFTMLHECGHILASNNDSFGIKKAIDKYPKNSKGYKSFTLADEIEAWKRGLTLCKRLNIEVDKKLWDKCFSEAIMKYMEWATRKD